MKKILIALLVLLSPFTAQAQQSKATLQSSINTLFADNTSNAITAAMLRSVTSNIVSSYVDWLTCTTSGAMIYYVGGTPTCLSAVAAGSVLTSGTAPSWANAIALGGATISSYTLAVNGPSLLNGDVVTSIVGSNQCLQANSAGKIVGVGGACGAAGNALLSGTVLSKSANYTAVTGDCGNTLVLGGSTQFTLTVNAASGYASNCGFIITNALTETRSKTIAINGLTSFFLYPGQSILLNNQNNVWSYNDPGDWQLAGAVTLYVRPDGSDSASTNDGLANSASGAYLTANKALKTIADKFDINAQSGGSVTIVHTCAAPPCTITAAAQLVAFSNSVAFKGGVPTYQGDAAGTTLAPSTTVQADIQLTYGPSVLNVGANLTLAGGANVSFGEYVSGGAILKETAKIIFGDITGAAASAHRVAAAGGRIFVLAGETISNTSAMFVHDWAYHAGQIEYANSLTITCTGSPPFTITELTSSQGIINTLGATYSSCGGVTGQRYNAQSLGNIDTNAGGPNYFPGNIAGQINSTTPGGAYQ